MSPLQKMNAEAESEKIKADAIKMLQNAISVIEERGCIGCQMDVRLPEREKPRLSWEVIPVPLYEPTGERVLKFTITLPARKE